MVKFHWIYLHKLTRLFSSNIRLLSNFPPFQLPDNFPTFQLSNFLVTWLNPSIWLSGYLDIWLSGYLAIWLDYSIWQSGWTHLLHFLQFHLLRYHSPPVAHPFSTCCSLLFHLLRHLFPLVDSSKSTCCFYILST